VLRRKRACPGYGRNQGKLANPGKLAWPTVRIALSGVMAMQI
jgi:hypothetical protein